MQPRRLPVIAAALLCLGASSPQSAREKEREALRGALSEVIKRSPLRATRHSIQVVSLDDGSVIFSRNPDDLLNPASNVKMVTAAAALARMGIEYRFETEFLTDAEMKDGKAKILYVRGKGDPSLTTDRLYGIVSELLHLGLKEVTGAMVIDETFFDSERLAPGFDQEFSDRSYMAPTGAVSLNWNAVGVYLRPGPEVGQKAVVEIEPASDYFTLESELTTGTRRGRRFSVTSAPDRDRQKQKIVAKGLVPIDERPGSWSVWKKIDNPPHYFGQTLKRLLTERGVKFKGQVKLGPVPSNAKLLHVAQSETFDVVLKRMNKNSSNFVAEQILKTLGAEDKGLPGSFPKGVEAVEDFLEKEVGLPRGSYVMKNGSGLNDANRFSAAQLCTLLRHMYQRFPVAPEYLSSVGVAGKDGTLKYRFEGSEAVGRLRAKTGTLENVSSLAGYVQAVGGEKFAFAILVNDFPGRAGTVVQHIDALGAAVAALGSPQGVNSAIALLSAPSVLGPIAEAKSRVATYLSLGRQGDRRNIPFLRTSWRTEKDPAVRAVIADSLYQSDPQDYLGVRILLDSFIASEEVYGRLRQVASELKVEVPGVSSVVELAASGNADALARLLELSRAAQGDLNAELDLAVAYSEVARTAPEELIMAFRSAAVPERDPGLGLLARGLVKAADPEHPFWPALRKAMGSLDPVVAGFAKSSEAVLSQIIAQRKAPDSPSASP